MRPTASWLSYAGALQRVRRLAGAVQNTGLRVVFWVLPGPLLLLLWWTLVTCWYAIWVMLFPIAFLVMVPWRLFRRSQRLAKSVQD